MKTAFIVHGAYGNPEVNWCPWLKAELESIGWKVIVPAFPTPEHQTLESWFSVWKTYEHLVSGESIFIGHSLGSAFLLHVLENMKGPVRASFLVASAFQELGLPEFDVINSTFYKKDFDWMRIRRNCEKFLVYASDNDPYVPGAHAVFLARELGAELAHIPGAGHFNRASGYTTFPNLLGEVRKLEG